MVVYLLFMTVLPAMYGYLLLPEDVCGPYALPAMWCAGWTVLMAALHWPAVACILLNRSLTELTVLYLLILGALLAASAARMVRRHTNPFRIIRNFFSGITFPELVALAATGFHAVVTFLYMHVDDDDYAFVSNATTSLDTNTLLRYIGGTGKALTTYHVDGIDRLVSSPHFTLFAVMSKLFGIRPAPLAHTFLPPFLTCLFFFVFFLIGWELFKGDRRKCGLFTVFAFVIYMSAGFSTYTAGSFAMIRSWQGKAQVAGLIVPLILWAYLMFIREGEMRAADVVLIAFFLEAACLMTSMGAMLAALEALLLSILAALILKKKQFFLRTIPALILPVLTAGVYLYMT